MVSDQTNRDRGMPAALRKGGMVLLLSAYQSLCPGAEPYGRVPIGLSTTPPSSYGQDLVTLPNPIEVGSNLLVTGNVAGGMQFRGFVPYSAPMELRTPVGSARLDPFLRRSEGALGGGTGWLNLAPFYSPTATATFIAPGSSDPVVPRVGWMSMLGPRQGTEGGSSAAQTGAAGGIRIPTLPLSPDLAQDSGKGVQPDLPGRIWADLWDALDTPSRAQDPPRPGAREDLGDANQPVDRAWPVSHPGLTERPGADPCGTSVAGVDPLEEAKRVRWVGSTQDLWQARYEQCMGQAAVSVRDGHPSLAVDAYSLALVYKPGDALALAGKCHALFACGEFSGSVLFLGRLLEICPDYARIQIDLPAWVGGEAVLRSRMEEARGYLQKNGPDPLRLALAYAHYRLGEALTARDLLDQVADKTPPWPILKRAVDETLAQGGPSPAATRP